jgi:predicted ferric reductase
MRSVLYGAFWIGLYLAISAAPFFILLLGETPPGRGFWREFSVGLGFMGLSMIGWQFFLTGRFKGITTPYGIDVVYHFHRLVSLIAFSFILFHPAIIIFSTPETIIFLNPLATPWWTASGMGGLFLFAVIIATSLFRMKFGLKYEHWRAIHGYLSVFAVSLSMFHIIGVNYYIQEPLKRWLWIFMATAWLLALIHVRAVKPLLMLFRPYTVEKVVRERGNSWTLSLKAVGHRGIDFKPGQFAWVTIGRSSFSIREHPFSFSSSSTNSGCIEMTIKELGDFTNRIGGILPGTRAYIDGPYGTFTIDMHRSPGYVLIAGGVGITPIMSIMKTMRDRVDRRPLILFYAVKALDSATFFEEIENLKRSLNLRVVYIPEEVPEEWDGERGLITFEVMARYLPENRFDYGYFVCGPQPMQIEVRAALDKLGLPLEKVQSESFNFV